jgi:non-ribosomal peptide synthetase component E (peptide arylation enzyme)
MNAADALLGRHDPQRTALVCGTERVTYGELRDSAARTAAALRSRGIARGERVAVKLPDGSAWVGAFMERSGPSASRSRSIRAFRPSGNHPR